MRINVESAGRLWNEKPLRFYERANRYVSLHPRD
jgi:hypothetical protein